MELQEILAQMKNSARRNTLCARKGYAASVSRLRRQRLRYISRDEFAQLRQKIRRAVGKLFRRRAPLKRERGELTIHPAVAPVSLVSACSACGHPQFCALGGQNLAALCTTAGQNLTAVGSSHSLTETVNLGTMTAAGLVGTLHNTYTSYLFLFHMLDSLMTAATHSIQTITVMPDHYNRKIRFGQQLFHFFLIIVWEDLGLSSCRPVSAAPGRTFPCRAHRA